MSWGWQWLGSWAQTCGQKFTNYNTAIWLFWVTTIDGANVKTKQPVVLLYVAASILVATVLHRNNLECTLGLPTQRSRKHIQIISMHSKMDDVINEQLLINSANLWSRCQRTRTLFGQWWRKASQKSSRKFLLTRMGVLAPRSALARPSAWHPINTSRNFLV